MTQVPSRRTLTVVPPPVPGPNLADPATRLALTPAALDGMIRLSEIWQLSTTETCKLLGDVPERSWFRMKKQESGLRLGPDMLTRISLLVGIFKGLRLLFSEPLSDAWIRLPNRGPLFGGARPLDVAIEGGIPRMLQIRQHVDALRGGL